MGAASANDTSQPSGEIAPLISVRLSPFRLCQRFKLVNRTLEPDLTLLAQVSAQWVPTAYGGRCCGATPNRVFSVDLAAAP
jgi:hypothetical protein